MTIPELESRLESHKANRDRLIAQAHAFNGAIDELSFHIEQAKSESTTEVSPEPTNA